MKLKYIQNSVSNSIITRTRLYLANGLKTGLDDIKGVDTKSCKRTSYTTRQKTAPEHSIA